MLSIIVFLPMVLAFVSYFVGRYNKNIRDYFQMFVCIITFGLVVTLIGNNQTFDINYVAGLGLHFKAEGIHVVLSVMASFIWMMQAIFSKEYFAHYHNRNRYYFFMLMTLGATLGVFLSADFFTCLFFFEIMSFTSFVLVMHDETSEAKRAAKTYLAVAVIGGLVTLMGLIMLYYYFGTLDYAKLAEAMVGFDNPIKYIIGVLILTGFAAKAGMFPLHIWLPTAHPVAPAPSSALLSAVLTKSGIFGVIMISANIFLHDATWGLLILVLGTITMVLGAILAVFSINLKRTLACSSLSQIGFIAVGIGMQGLLGEHNALAAAGTMLHIVNHGMIKLVLFCFAGAVYMNLHKLNLNEIRGYGRKKPILQFVYLMGALGIGGIPLWNGYISKTLLHESIVEMIALSSGEMAIFLKVIEMLFLFAGGLTLAYMTKIYVALFVEKNKDQAKMDKTKGTNLVSTIVLVIPAIILGIFGLFPAKTLDVIANYASISMHAHHIEGVHYFAFVNLKGAIISIIIGAVVYFGFIRTCLMKDGEYVDRWPKWLNLENMVYRPLLLNVLPFVGAMIARVIGSITDGLIALSKVLVFNQDNGVVIPPEDEKIIIATLDPYKTTKVNLAKALVLFGLGLTITLIYLLFW